jgi:hypothetical protein
MNPPGNLLRNSYLGFGVLGVRNSRFDFLQLMLNFREISLRLEAPFIRNFGTSLEPRDSPFQGRAIDHPPEKDTQRGSKRGKEQQRISRSGGNSIA